MAVCVVCWSVPFYIASFSACRCAFHSISRHATAFNGDTSSIVFSGVVHPLHELGLNDSIRIKRPTVAATSHQQLRENQSNLNSFSLIESISFITLHRLFFPSNCQINSFFFKTVFIELLINYNGRGDEIRGELCHTITGTRGSIPGRC